MCGKGFLKRVVSFSLALTLGLAASAFWSKEEKLVDKIRTKVKSTKWLVYANGIPRGNGNSGCCDTGRSYSNSAGKMPEITSANTKGVKIISKPRAVYTEQARANQVQGKVVLRVTFSANDSIGSISVISGLPDGLTEQSIAAAREIKFKPATRGGVLYSVTKPVEYTFSIY